MKLRKILAAVAAAAVAVSTMAVNVFAADPVTIQLDSSYAGDWGSSDKTIKREEFDKFDGDVKVVLTVEVTNKAADHAYLIKPMDKDKSWDSLAPQLTAEKQTAKPDGWMQVRADQTEVEFVVPSAIAKDLWGAGIGFQVYNVIVKSATLSDGSPENALVEVTDADTNAYCNGTLDPFAAPAADEATDDTTAAADESTDDKAAPVKADSDDLDDDDADADIVDTDDDDDADSDDDVADTAAGNAAADTTDAAAPAADTTTAAAATGNVAVASIVTVMAVAGAAAIVSKKRK